MSEVLQAGYVQTAPSGNVFTFTPHSNTNLTGEDFGNASTTSVSGEVYNDANASGTLDSGESGLGGWTVTLSNGSTVLTTTTSASGTYSFTHLAPGSYTLSEVVQSGFVATSPASGSVPLTLASGQTLIGQNFGDFQTITIGGSIYNDIPGLGSFQSGDLGLAGWYLNLVGGGTTLTAVTNASGSYTFTGVGPGSYVLETILPTGYVLTAPAAGSYPIIVSSETNIVNENFLGFQTVSFTGAIFNDLNGNGALDSGESGLSGWVLRLVGGSTTYTTTSGLNGTYTFNGIGPGTYTLQEVLQGGYINTLVGGGSFTTTSGGNVTNQNFGNFQTVNVSGTVFNDVNGNGALDSGDGGLQGWTINLVSGTTTLSTTSSAGGTYSFTGVGPGTYTLSEIAQSGYVLTSSAIGPFTTQSGVNVSNENFADFQTVAISGTVFNDVNGDGALDNGEAGIAGATVNLVRGTTTLTTTTSASGTYTFTGVGPGTYTLSEVLPSGYVQTAPGGGIFTITTASGTSVGSQNFGDTLPATATVSGEVYNDLNGNGALDSGEPGLAGWTVKLTSGTTTLTATTNSGGTFTFANVAEGSYTLTEVLQAGFVPTAPAGGSFAVNVTSSSSVTGQNFGDYLPGSVGGEVFNDQNGNGALDSGDPGLAGWTVKLTGGTTTLTTTTSASGTYSFSGVTPGNYTLSEVVQGGFVQTAPVAGSFPVFVTSGSDISNDNFGDFQTVSVSGNVFNDINGDGSQEGGEPGLAGWTVNLVQGTTTLSVVTNASGAYTFTGVGPGSYTLSEVVQSGFVQTAPAANVYTFTTSSGLNVAGGSFGDTVPASGSVSGEVYNDLNGNGALDSGEPGLAGWTVKLTSGTTTLTATTTASGTYTFTGLAAGSYTLSDVVQGGFVPTAPGGGSFAVNLTSTSSVTGDNFGAFQTVSVSGNVFNDINGDGSQEGGEPGLAGWTVNLVQGTTTLSVVTNASGAYTFTGVGPGSYTLSEVVQSGFVQTAPAANVYTFTTSSGLNVAGGSFGNTVPASGSVSGEVYNDLNGNGALDSGEPGLAGWTVTLTSGSTTLSTTTSASGTYTFTGVAPGTYTLGETLQSGFVATVPSDGSASVTVPANASIAGPNFGDFKTTSVSGEVFNDLNGNGALDSGEPGLAGWTVNLVSKGTTLTTTTGTGGTYTFSGVGPGAYTLSEVLQSGYLETEPREGDYTFSATSGTNLSGENFGDQSVVTTRDNSQAGYFQYGKWTVHAGGFNNNEVTADPTSSPTAVAYWTVSVPSGSSYTLWSTWVASASNADNAVYTVYDGSTILGTFSENQKTAPAGGRYLGDTWTNLGTFNVKSGSLTFVLAAKGADGLVEADAVMVARSGLDQDAPAPAPNPTASATSTPLTSAELAPIVTEAKNLWKAAGVSAAGMAALDSANFQIADLGATKLALTSGNTIWISSNAAGYSWYVDPTTGGGSAFGVPVNGHEFTAASGSPAADKMDLLTVVTHELGHILGLGEFGVGDVMTQVLESGTRRLPTTGDLANSPYGPAPTFTTVSMATSTPPVTPLLVLPTGTSTALFQVAAGAGTNKEVMSPSSGTSSPTGLARVTVALRPPSSR